MLSLEKLKLLFAQNKSLIVLFGVSFVLFLILFVSIILVFFSTGRTNQSPLAHQAVIPQRFSSLKTTDVGKTNESQIPQDRVTKKELLADGRVKYTLRSPIQGREDEVYTKDGVVVFESTSIFTTRFGDLPDLDVYTSRYGDPDAIIENNALYGWFTNAYIYADEGFMLIANKFTKEVYEIERFLPTTPAKLQLQYPEYFEKGLTPKEMHKNAYDK